MTLVLGADTLCWHLRLEHRDLTLEQCFAEAADAGARFVQLSLHHAREYEHRGSCPRWRAAPASSGSSCWSPATRSAARTAARRRPLPARAWSSGSSARPRSAARSCASPRVSTAPISPPGPGAIEAERRWTIEALGGALPAARAAGIVLAIENHSDFTVAEYRSILEATGDVRVFLDLINPVSALEDPEPVVRALAPLAVAGHVKDYALESIWTEGQYHRRGFNVLWRYPGEGVADLRALLAALGERDCTSRSRVSTTGPTGATRSSGCAAASRSAARSPRRRTDVRCIVFTGAGGNEVVALQERPDPGPAPRT